MLFLGSVWKSFGGWSRSVSDEVRFGLSPLIPECRVVRRSRCVRQTTPDQVGSSRRRSDTYIMEIARSTCSNGRVWQELRPVEWRLLENRKVQVASENATMAPSHGDSLHTAESSLQISATLPALGHVVCGRGVVPKSAPCGGSRS